VARGVRVSSQYSLGFRFCRVESFLVEAFFLSSSDRDLSLIE